MKEPFLLFNAICSHKASFLLLFFIFAMKLLFVKKCYLTGSLKEVFEIVFPSQTIYILHSECLLSSLALYLCGKQVCWEATLSDNDALLWHFICKMRWLWKTEQPIHTHYTFVFVFLTKVKVLKWSTSFIFYIWSTSHIYWVHLKALSKSKSCLILYHCDRNWWWAKIFIQQHIALFSLMNIDTLVPNALDETSCGPSYQMNHGKV